MFPLSLLNINLGKVDTLPGMLVSTEPAQKAHDHDAYPSMRRFPNVYTER
jgi:hypothetical protein